MGTECYAMVRGSALRVTTLLPRGGLPAEIGYVATKSVAKVILTEVSESGGNELLRNERGEPRLHFVRNTQTTHFLADIEFTRCDPGLLSLITGVPVVENAAGDVVGFDVNTRLPVTAFAMELWSKIAGADGCDDLYPPGSFGEGGFGEGGFGVSADTETGRKWGYTLFPFLRGGFVSGFTFANGLVSFNLKGAKVCRGSRWGYGPYALVSTGAHLHVPVSGNTHWRQILLRSQPPAETNGITYFTDIIEGGSAALTSPDIIEGGDAAATTEDIIDGGTAA